MSPLTLPLAIPTMSLSKPGLHSLDHKLRSASSHGYLGIELFIDDLMHFSSLPPFNKQEKPLHAAAEYTSTLAQSLGLTILCLQPFGFYEGLIDREQTERLLSEKLEVWFELCEILKTDLIQIPANFLPYHPETKKPQTTGDMGVIVSDLQRIADIGAARGFRFVYEALCWSNHIDTWEASFEIVKRVNRPNFGLCLDSFNIAGRIYADPAAESGKTPNAEEAVSKSMQKLRDVVASGELDISKIFYIQLVDGERLSSPLDSKHPFYVAGQPTRMNWSRNARLFPCEEERGGYLPVLEIARTFIEIGYTGWVSLELFSRSCNDVRYETVDEHAERGVRGWGRLVRALGVDVEMPVPRGAENGNGGGSEKRRLEEVQAVPVPVPVQHRL
ncbi:sugar phosphate isomerase/epimerase family protein [Aspergillus stella-maris]|uniref:sugar phosphate isomerase/epimerase family protein n=1 Tax=Aspergillus stella-maris TaxID=1810926 RepID=UPI003CCD77A8